MKKQILSVFLLVSVLGFSQETTEKPKNSNEKKIEEVTIKKTKKAVEQKADRTIFDFSEQEHLSSGTAMEGIKKLPGLMVSDITGMSYQGKMLDVYMDGRPLGITSNELNAFLEGMPANSIEKIEVITSPGAEFPATSGGAVLNIITSKSAKNYLTATYSGDYSFSNYDKYRSKTNNSLLLNSKNKWFGWQLNVGQTYDEGLLKYGMQDLSAVEADNKDRGYFAKAALTFNLGLDRVILNYDINYNNNDARGFSSGVYNSLAYSREDETNNDRLRQEATVTYQKRFDDAGKNLDLKFTYTKRDNDFKQNNLNFNSLATNVLADENTSDSRTANFRVDYSQDLHILDKGKIKVGGLYERLDFDTENQGIKNLDYQRQTASAYVELQASLKKWDFILGGRAEDYDISGITYNSSTSSYDNLTNFKQYRFFPNASVQYNFTRGVYFAVNYNKKINLPSISFLNPNNSTYSNNNIQMGGNANLQPTIYDNFGVKLSAFDYVFLGYDYNIAKNQVVQKTVRVGDLASTLVDNLDNVKEHNFSLGFPIPLAIFKGKSMKELMATNPDKMSFFYIYTGYWYRDIPDFDTKGLWIFNVTSQFALPAGLKLMANYTNIPANGYYYYYQADKPLNHSLNITLSKKFLKDRLNVSLYANDVFNTEEASFTSKYQQPFVNVNFKRDSRAFGISVNYKLPTKNKLAQEDPNLLKEEKKENSGGFIQQP